MGSVNNKESRDEIGKLLVRRASVSGAELEAIVDRDDLFSGVMKRIATAEKVEVRKFSLGMGAAYATVSLAVAVIATVTIFALLRTTDLSSGPSIARSSVPAAQPDAAVPQPARPPQDETQVPKQLTAGSGDQRMIMADSKTYTPVRRPPAQRPIRPSASDDDGDFYPVSYAGNETLAGGRIVRMDLPRAQAFAMGIRVPLENDSETVKADVIIGPDGVPRAVRLVR
ncbi:MAG TPA: hypothetical protein VGI80_03445 [Pyrinomonadaceae bacterium]|jgi:hypothetical protein